MIIIKVPATTANIGPGYDSQGMALKLYNVFKFTEEKSSIEENNLIYKSFKYFYTRNNISVPEVKIEVNGDVPLSRGLGSSATCIVAGLMAANEMSKLKLDKKEILKYATEIEGHPDNVAPAIYGGHITSIVNEDVFFSRREVSDNYKFYLLIPDFELQTKVAREVVKTEVKLSDAVSNIARATLVSDALSSGDFKLLKGAAKDLLHEPYRKKLISDYPIFEKICKLNSAVMFISGAGPSLLVIAEKENSKIEQALKNSGEKKAVWKALKLEVSNEGATIL
ncbi:homoserine kinase [Anaerosphaera aminiphila DSM 21120]|uniref:Homoserine kinase n=1 Tax=Anaerosphaera aminiphila DSM 21120 TaxID=1120995 RepID=A0A1M5RLE6_9FIRM|nr:homoserine kinase [Anaerosphaera aminiphila]SHH27144.1 homoserine kinase [Anaerosphaera aminiphila DSM 21120]